MTDAIVIGSGVNGLVCAAALAHRGWRVHVLERADAPGGAVKTREATLAGFRHDTGAMNLSLFAGSEFNRTFGQSLVDHGLKFVPVTNCFATAFSDGRWFGVSTDLETTIARTTEFSAADAETWRRLVQEFADDAPQIFSVLGTAMSPWSLAKTFFRIWRARGGRHIAEMIRLLLQSPRGFLEETFESEHIRVALAAWGMHLDFPPDQGGGALFPYLEAMANQSFGMVIGKGGSGCLTNALVGIIESKGGTVEMDAEVTGILTSAGATKGVRLADGKEISAAKAVVANTAPSALLRLLGGTTGSDRYDTGIHNFTHAPGTMMIHLAMDDLPDWAASRDLRRFAYVHLAPSMRQMTLAYTDARAGLLPSEPVLVVGQPTTVDPSRAPEGKHVLWVQVRMVPGDILGDAAGKIAATDWTDAAEPFADRAMGIIERYAPGTKSKVLSRTVVSPKELEAENPNLIGGDQIAGSHHPWQNFLFRPVLGYADWSTPVKNLHLIGAGTWPGAGVGAGSGMGLAKRIGG